MYQYVIEVKSRSWMFLFTNSSAECPKPHEPGAIIDVIRGKLPIISLPAGFRL